MNSFFPLSQEDLKDVFLRVGKTWEKLKDQNIFLTGASGFFGSWLLETLLFANDQLNLNVKIWALTRNVNHFYTKLPHLTKNSAIQLVGEGIEKFSFPKEKMNYIIHSIVPDSTMELLKIEKWFETATSKLLELAIRDKSKGFLLCSTGAVYQAQNRPLQEEDPLIPLDGPLSYGRIRRQVEDQCLSICKNYDIPLKIARGFAFAGPRLPENSGLALVDFLHDAKKGRPIQVKGTGESIRSYLYASDMATWLWLAFLNLEGIEIFNLGSEEPIRLIDLANQISLISKTSVKIHGQIIEGAAKNNFYIPIISKNKKLNSYIITKNLQDILNAAFSSQKTT